MSLGLTERLEQAYRGRRVLLTGHTGFKGAWLTLWLSHVGAQLAGFALPAEAGSFFDELSLGDACERVGGDVRSLDDVLAALDRARPELIVHLAAQSLVPRSFDDPLTTVDTNVLGTTNLLEAVRRLKRPVGVVVVTSDKCYANRPSAGGYTEDDPLGGDDVYSGSKAAAEIIVGSFRCSFFHPARLAEHGVAVASARAGNVLGGGDWSSDRLVPDAVRALIARRPIQVRNPEFIRPWQHVLEPLCGYLLLGERLMPGRRRSAWFCEPWNFAPPPDGNRTVRELVDAIVARWGEGSWEHEPTGPTETRELSLNSHKAAERLGWTPRWTFSETCDRTIEWYRARERGAEGPALRALALAQIDAYASGAGPATADRVP